MNNDGHLICNHTAKHKDMSRITEKSTFKAELEKLENIYRNATGKEMAKIYRPPEGRFSELNLKHATELGYKTVFWSFAYADWDNKNQMSQEEAIERILDCVHNGAIILLHPTSTTNADIMSRLIRELKGQGYRFETLDNLP
jgi:peptidoglycan-N-acetylmuramic acid deacetylase